MAQPANTHDRFDLNVKGDSVREDLADYISNIDPDETPFCSNAGKGKSGSDLKEWLLDNLGAVNTGNAHIAGDDFAGEVREAPKRLNNYHQISKKQVIVDRRADKLTKAGRKSEIVYELVKAGKEIKRDREAIIVGSNQAALQGDDATAPLTADLTSWLRTNTDRGAGGADPTLSNGDNGMPNAAAGAGTPRALSEASVHARMADAYIAGGTPNVMMMGALVKGRHSNYMFSSSARIATPYQDHQKNQKSGVAVIGAVDWLTTDYGTLHVVPNRFQNESDVFLLDMKLFEISYIDDMLTETMGKTGDSVKRHILSDYALCSKQEAGSAVIADIDPAVPMVA